MTEEEECMVHLQSGHAKQPTRNERAMEEEGNNYPRQNVQIRRGPHLYSLRSRYEYDATTVSTRAYSSSWKASVVRQRLSYLTETVLSNEITRGRIVLGGHPYMTSAKFWDFLTPCPHLGLIYCTKFKQPPLLHLLLG